jgi:hypothetical protein
MTQLQIKLAMDRIRCVAGEDGNRLRTDYSGRGMCGRTCVGIVTEYPTDVIAAVGLRGAQIDSMGRRSIVYWRALPGFTNQQEEN